MLAFWPVYFIRDGGGAAVVVVVEMVAVVTVVCGYDSVKVRKKCRQVQIAGCQTNKKCA